MPGNVWEWVQDWYGTYTAEPVTDPQGPASGSIRVIRGGGWLNDAGRCRSAYRLYVTPGGRVDDLGFRLLRTAP
jgi:formylglycine-generating enzyme required for sulfatase activity